MNGGAFRTCPHCGHLTLNQQCDHPACTRPRLCLVCETPCQTEGQLCGACAAAGHRVTDTEVIVSIAIDWPA